MCLWHFYWGITVPVALFLMNNCAVALLLVKKCACGIIIGK
jgi:hypothetical protein